MSRIVSKPRAASKPLPQTQLARREYAKIPKLGKEKDPAEYTKEPHAYGDVLIQGGKLGGAVERDLLYWIMRNTWGKNVSKKEGLIERPEYTKLSITQAANLCQVWDEEKNRLRPIERKTAAIALARMERDGIIASRDRTGCGDTTAKMYKATPERWKKAPAYKPPTPKQIAEVEASLEDEEESDQEPPMPEVAAGAAVPVASGKFSKPQPTALSIAKDQPTVTIRVVYNPQGFSEAIAFRCRPGRNGRLVVTAQPESYGCAQPQRYAVSSPSKNIVTVESERVDAYKTFISRFVREIFGKSADKRLIESIVSASGGAPIETYKTIVNTKFLGSRKKHQSGLLIDLATDASVTHQDDIRAERAAAAERTRRTASPPPSHTEEPPAAPIAHSAPESKENTCWYCHGARQIGTGADRSACGICRGTGEIRRKAATC